jgi:hypothetical protein
MDCYNLKNDWEQCKLLIDDFEKDLFLFIGNPLSRKKCTSARKKSKEAEHIGQKIKKNIIKQRQDYNSDYS